MEIFDFHTHIYPEKIAQKAVKSISEFYDINMSSNGTPDHLLDIGKQSGISKFVVHSVATGPSYVQSINNFLADECTKHTEFIGFGTLHPDFPDLESEINRIEKIGLKGIKIHPDIQKFNMDEGKLLNIYEIIEGRLPILIHCGDYRYDYSHPRRLAHILDLFPKLTVIGAHFGGWSIFDLAVEYLENKQCYLDVSSSMGFLGLRRTKELIDIYGAERMLFGSDYPMWSPKDELERVYALNLPESILERLLYKNAIEILNI